MESTNPFADKSQTTTGPRLESAASSLNPYAAPAGVEESFLERGPGVGIWRHGDLAVIHQSLDFPERCIWTNEPGAYRGSTTLTYSAWFGLSQGSIKFAYSLSTASIQKKNRNVLYSLGILGAGVAFWIVGFFLANANFDRLVLLHWITVACGWLGILSLVAGSFLFRNHSRPLWIVHRDGLYFAVGGTGEPFLRSLPRWQGTRVSRA